VKYLYLALYIVINCLYKQGVVIVFKQIYYQELYILIIKYNSVITVVKVLDGRQKIDGRFETHSRYILAKQITSNDPTGSNFKSDRE
jgi:hypothetical protein